MYSVSSTVCVLVPQCEQEPPQKRLKSVNSALCVAVNGDHVAVGYHGEGIGNFSLDTGVCIQTLQICKLDLKGAQKLINYIEVYSSCSHRLTLLSNKKSKKSKLDVVNKETMSFFSSNVGEMTWASSEYDASILCLLWVVLDAKKTEPELLVSGGTDKHLRVWKREEGEEGERGCLKAAGMFAAQRGSILALAQSSTYLASASGECEKKQKKHLVFSSSFPVRRCFS